jgi:hypothetical protein
MFREPRPSKKVVEVRPSAPKNRFQIRKLEERIAPKHSKFDNGDNGNHYGQNK